MLETRGAQANEAAMECGAEGRAHGPMKAPYYVHLEGDSVTVRDMMEVRQAFLVLLENALGGPERVIACFRAWTMQMENGFQWMDEKDVSDARAWQETFAHAQDAARKLLSRPDSSNFVFKLV
jgi:hypothetical protein